MSSSSSSSSSPIVLITGANKGLGYACVEQLLLSHPDWHILLGSRSEKNGIDAVQKLLKLHSTASNHLTPFTIDVCNTNSILTGIEIIRSKYGRLDILISNAGIAPNSHNAEQSQLVLQTNILGNIELTNATLSLLQQSQLPIYGGRIIYVSSTVGSWCTHSTPEPYHSLFEKGEDSSDQSIQDLITEYIEIVKSGVAGPTKFANPSSSYGSYGVSKAFLNLYARSIAKRYKDSLTVAIVCPGYCATDLNHQSGIRSTQVGAKSILGGLEVDRADSGKSLVQDGKTLTFSFGAAK